ncbi:MAG TPA: helix-turn-helix domain-containing protein [Actinomycetota bacterium]
MEQQLQAIAEALAARLGRSVLIGDRAYRLLAHSRTEEQIDDIRRRSILEREGPREAIEWVERFGVDRARAPVTIPSNDVLGMAARVCVPLWSHGMHLGFLWLMDPEGTLGEAELEIAQDMGRSAAHVLYQTQVLKDLEQDVARHLMSELLSDDPGRRAVAATELRELGLFEKTREVVALVLSVRGDGDASDERRLVVASTLDRARRATLRGYSAILLRSTHGVILVDTGDPAIRGGGIDGFGELILKVARRPPAEKEVRAAVGIGDPSTLEAAFESYEEAQAAARIGQRVSPGRSVSFWRDLGVYRILARLPEQGVKEAVPNAFRSLSESDHGRELLQTLETYLDLGCNGGLAASALHLHRSSLYRRIRKVEELTGVDLSQGEQRLATHLWIKLLRLEP